MSYKITSSCVGCTLCAKGCPVEAISGELKSLHEINEKRCVSCGVCGNVCHNNAILDDANNPTSPIKKGDWKKPFVDDSICSACSICIELCAFGCLGISNNPGNVCDTAVHAELVAAERCVGCSICEKGCPIGAITMKGVSI